MRQPRHRLSRAAAISGAAFALSTIGSSLHYVAVTHTVCPEHGDWVHGEPTSHGDAHDAGSGQTAASVRPDAAAENGVHEHEHCLLCGPARKGVTAAIVQWAPRAHAPGERILYRARLASVASYRTAPKTSPPV